MWYSNGVISIHEVFADLDVSANFLHFILVISIHEVFAGCDDELDNRQAFIKDISIHTAFAGRDSKWFF